MDLKRLITLGLFALPLAFIAYAAVMVALSSPWDWSDRSVGQYRLEYWRPL